MGSEMQVLKRQAVPPKRAGTKPLSAAADSCEPEKMLLLLQAAETIFLGNGYHTATMTDVAKAAGMSKKTVYKLVDSKSDLFAALIEHHAGKLNMPAMEENWTRSETLVQTLLCVGQYIFSPKQIAVARLILTEYSHSNDFGRIFHRRRVNRAKILLENALSEIGGQNNCRGIALREMSAMLFGMALGEFHVSTLVGFRPAPGKTAMLKRIRCAVDIFLTGLEHKPDSA